jgi:hypothetical protein
MHRANPRSNFPQWHCTFAWIRFSRRLARSHLLSNMETVMTTTRHEEKPWQPRIDRNPEFNPFVNPLDRELENPPPLEELESDDEQSTRNTDELTPSPQR